MHETEGEAPSRVSDEEYRILADFRYALRRFLSFSEQAARHAGITTHQYQVLLAIRGFPGRERLTVSELADQLKLRHHSTVGMIDRLASQDLLVRLPGMSDRRQVYVSLTARGSELLERLAAVHRDELRRIGAELRGPLARLDRDEE
jgi:DNA-binding MarR family transcriptional regulator